MKESKEFKEWLIIDYVEEVKDAPYSFINHFDKLPFEFKWGVYLKFFDEKGIYLDTIPFDVSKAIDERNWTNSGVYRFSVYINEEEFFLDGFKTRQEAQQEAIKKAFEILEKKD